MAAYFEGSCSFADWRSNTRQTLIRIRSDALHNVDGAGRSTALRPIFPIICGSSFEQVNRHPVERIEVNPQTVYENECIVGESAATFRGGGFVFITSNSLSDRHNLPNEARDLYHQQHRYSASTSSIYWLVPLPSSDSTQPIAHTTQIVATACRRLIFSAKSQTSSITTNGPARRDLPTICWVESATRNFCGRRARGIFIHYQQLRRLKYRPIEMVGSLLSL